MRPFGPWRPLDGALRKGSSVKRLLPLRRQRFSGRLGVRNPREAASVDDARPSSTSGAPEPGWVQRTWLLGVAAASAGLVAALWSVRDREWSLTGDWASIDLRVRQVGSAQTPLIGAYSTRGWAHPGPIIYWLAAPVQWLNGGDARGLYLTAALVNILAMLGIAWVVNSRQGRGMAAAVTVAMALLVYGLRPFRVIDIWNPLLPLFPLLLVTFLAWSAVTGRRGHGIAAIAIGALVGQAHVGLLPILAVIALWAVAWVFITGRTGYRHEQTATGADEATGLDPYDDAPSGDPSTFAEGNTSWRRVLTVGGLTALVLWIPPLIDQILGTGNLGRVFRYFTGGAAKPIGIGSGLVLVARNVRPDGPWIGGADPVGASASTVGSSPVYVLVVVVVLGLLTWALWRTGDSISAAGTSLAAILVLAAVPIASRLDEPLFDYLLRWIEVVGAVAWFWIGWGTWRLVRHRVPAELRLRMPAVGVAAALAVAAFTIPDADQFTHPAEREVPAVQTIRLLLEAKLPKDRPVRIEHRGDLFGNLTSGVIYWMLRDGYQVVTTDGREGLKYGPDARWFPGDEPRSEVYTVAVDYSRRPGNAISQCSADPGVRAVASYAELSPAEELRLGQLNAKALFEPASVTAAERQEGRSLGGRSLQVTVFVGDHVCSDVA